MNYIYCYTNKVNQHKYVGQTNNLKRRRNEHYSCAYNPKSVSYNCLFHQKIREYGINNFLFEVLEIIYDASQEYVNNREQY
jgi:group I intron endonuclease